MTHPAIAALLSIPPKPLPGCDLLARLYAEAPANVDDLLAVGPEIEEEIQKANKLAYKSQEATRRCLELKPVSAPQAPLGF